MTEYQGLYTCQTVHVLMVLKFGKHIQSYEYTQHVLTARLITMILSKANNNIGQDSVEMLDILIATETENAKNVSEMVSAHGRLLGRNA